MSATASREAYFEAGLAVLSESGYGSFKMGAICKRLGVTTGSFYHFFKNWSDFTEQLLSHWYSSRTEIEMSVARTDADPLHRIKGLIAFGLQLPHGAEAAIRTWAAIDPAVATVLRQADRERYTIVYESVLALLDDADAAHRYASWSMYLLTGYEQATLPPDVDTLEWSAQQIIRSLTADVRRMRRSRTSTVDRKPAHH
ncbi:TetR/AcrR family transcriptional regulator [Gordonia sp. NPDC003376]